MSHETQQPEEPTPLPLYQNGILARIAATDERLEDALNGLRKTDELIDFYRDENPPIAESLTHARRGIEDSIRTYLNTSGYQWEEQFPESSEES